MHDTTRHQKTINNCIYDESFIKIGLRINFIIMNGL